MNKKAIIKAAKKAVDPLAELKSKFTKLKALRDQITAMKILYQQHDALMEELLPLFIKVEADKFVISREISLGTEKYKLSPYFYDEKKGQLRAKVWKSAAYSSVAIE